MPKGKFKNRLTELFTNIEPVEPEPPHAAPDVPPIAGQEQPRTGAPLPRAGLQDAPLPASELPGSLLGLDDPLAQHSPLKSSPFFSEWGNFLDGIRRDELISYVYDQSDVRHADAPEIAPDGTMTVDAPILVSGEEIGKLILASDPERAWTDEDRGLVDVIAQQLAQQIETLRLLDESQRSRGEAEQAFHRLARQTGHTADDEQQVLANLPAPRGYSEKDQPLGYVLENEEVKPVASLPEGNGTVLETPIRISDGLLGSLQVGGEQLSDADIELVETVAQRLGHQVENLRLLEESQHFRSETEEAIRRLTHQSWQSYLNSTAKSSLAFQYDRSRVTPLDLVSALEGKHFPLRVREEVIGELAVDPSAAKHEDAVSLVNIIADRLSTHLDGLRLAEQREQALSESELLYGISSRLSTAQSLEDALSSVSEPARGAGAHDSRLFITTLDERGQPDGLNLAAIWYPEDGAQIVPVSAYFTLADYPAYWPLLGDPYNPLLVSDVLADPRLEDSTRDLFTRSGARAMALLPLAISGRWVGAVFINWDQPHFFSEQENRLYASLSRQAAVVVNNRLLLEQTRKRAQELQTVAQVSTAASTILDPLELLQSVVNLTKSSFGLYHVQVYIHHERENVLEVIAGSGENSRVLTDRQPWASFDSSTPVARAARTRQVVIANDVESEPDFVHNPLLPDVRSEIALPMIVGDRLMGVFNVQANATNRFSREDARIYTTLATQVAVALQNAELYVEQTATVERLRELDHLKSAFLANMSHELRTPLNSILGFAEVLLLGLDGPLNEVMTSDVHLIEKNGKHLLSLINDVLDMAKIEAGKMNLTFEKFVLRELLEETLDITRSLAREKALTLSIEPDSQDSMELSADRVRIRQVLINVVANAVKFTEKGGIGIRVVQFPEDRKIQIRVQDTGIGIPKDKLEHIFDSFSQVDTSTTRKAGGTGLGLPISRRLVEMHGGRLWAESTGVNGEGSMFIIELFVEAVKS